MRHFWVITLLPEMFDALQLGVVGRAIARKQAHLTLINLRDFGIGNYRRVDERPIGGGAGMVLMAEPLTKAIAQAKMQAAASGLVHCPVVYLSPQGKTLSESVVCECLGFDGLILLCGRYEGIDERVMAQVDFELSIGDYVLTGGELAAMVVLDSVIRRLPDVMNDDSSAQQDSFVDGLLDYPNYTKPLEFASRSVPNVLTSGHHQKIAEWRFKQQLQRTRQKRPDLYWQFLIDCAQDAKKLSPPQQKWLAQFKASDAFKVSD